MPSFDLDAIVIGGGIAGLASAVHLKRNGQNVRLFERNDHLGGVIRTLDESGYLIETGPNSLFLRPEDPLLAYISFLGIADRTVYAGDTGKKRFVLHEGHPIPLPMSILQGLTTPLLSFSGKLRILREAWTPPLENETDEESISEFVTRRFGSEFLDRFIDPFVKGVYAGNPGLLSMEATFPRLTQMEIRYGSILRGALALQMAPRKKSSPLTRTIFSFRKGMAQLPSALSAYLDGDAGTNSEIIGCAPVEGGYRVSILFEEEVYYMTSRHIVLSGSASQTAGILAGICPEAVIPLTGIPYAPIAVVYMGFPRKNISHPLDGFGLLIPEKEKRKILGILFSSSLFPDRAPEDHVLLTVFVGGMGNPKLALSFDEDLLEMVGREVNTILGSSGSPSFLRIQRWEEAIPQYTKGHNDRVRRVRQVLPENLHLAGAYLDGVSVTQSFSSGIDAANAILRSPGPF